jgi:hypothetical protein
VPSMDVLSSPDASSVAEAVRGLVAGKEKMDEGLAALDTAVFDLYRIGEQERLVVLDGLERAKREWAGPRIAAEGPAAQTHLRSYAEAFLGAVNAWQAALGRKQYSGEIFSVKSGASLRVLRFVNDGNGSIRQVPLDEELTQAIARIGARMHLPIAQRLTVARELRVHADGELLIIKPSARRYWTPAAALNDADAALGDGISGVQE